MGVFSAFVWRGSARRLKVAERILALGGRWTWVEENTRTKPDDIHSLAVSKLDTVWFVL
jgi:hypothetical protein